MAHSYEYFQGYQPSERRKIEQEAFTGKILGLVATNALELGVDIGVLDAVIVFGFPLSLASFVGNRLRPFACTHITTAATNWKSRKESP